MNKLLNLLRREFYEHRGMLTKTPLIIALAAFALVAVGVLTGVGGSADSDAAYRLLPEQDKLRLIFNSAFMASFAPILIWQSIAIFYYSVNGLFQERQDKSILFWKSMPVSDGLTVVSKLVVALLFIPAFNFIVAMIATMGIMLVMTAALLTKGINLFAGLLTASSLYLIPAQIVALAPVFMLWALPTVGWLFMVSSWARSHALLWAIGIPLSVMSLVALINAVYGPHWDANLFIQNVPARGLDGVLPGAWTLYSPGGMGKLFDAHQALDLTGLFYDGWNTLRTSKVWIAAAVGIAMLMVSIRLRKFHAEA